MIEESYKLFGLGAIIAIWAGSGYVLLRFRNDDLPTLSKHVNQSRIAYLVLGIALTINAIGFLIFNLKWFAPLLGLPYYFDYLFWAIAVSTFLAGWVPDIGKSMLHFVHVISAYLGGLTLLSLALLTAIIPQESWLVRGYALFTSLILAAGLIYMRNLQKKGHRFVKFQALFVLTYHLLMLLVIFSY